MQPYHTYLSEGGTAGQRSRASRYDWQIRSRILALHHFNRAIRQGWIDRLIDALRGRSSALLRLADIPQLPRPDAEEILGVQSVPLSLIRGSQGRAYDFDRHFAPLHEHLRERWVNLAALHSEGHPLPPVELVQVGKIYYVLDGHHRISVAYAFNDEVIDAYVTRWLLAAPAPVVRGEPAMAR